MDKKKLILIVSSIITLITLLIIVLLLTNKKTEAYKVSFETSGGSLVESQIVEKGKKLKKTVEPTKEGYIFVEWTCDGKTYDFSLEVEEDLILTAKWQKKDEAEEFIIKFNSDGGTPISNQIIEKENKIEKPMDPSKEGYTFKGWYLNDKIFDFDKIVEENIELKAIWEKIKENVNTQDHTSNNNQPTKPSNNEVELTTPTITRGGYGGDAQSGTIGMELKLNSTDGITGVEIYSSTTEDGIYTLQKTVKKEEWNSSTSGVNAQKGQHLYFKVRTYVKNSSGTYYSGYSNVLELNNNN